MFLGKITKTLNIGTQREINELENQKSGFSKIISGKKNFLKRKILYNKFINLLLLVSY
jgi:hypothetical protein